MTPAACPECGRAVDPLRARAVGVKGGKVVAYCSADCKAKAEGGPTVRDDSAGTRVTVRTPAKGVPVAAASPASSPIALAVPQSAADLDSGPIIEIIREKSEPAREPTPVPTRKPKRADTDTRAMQPPDDYDDSDLGPPEEDVPDDGVQPRSPIRLILIAIVLAAVAAAVAFALK